MKTNIENNITLAKNKKLSFLSGQ